MADEKFIRNIFEHFLDLNEGSVVKVKNNESSVYCFQNLLFVDVYVDGETLTGSFVVKTFKDVVKGVHSEFFKTEILMYTKIIPILSPDIHTVLPKHFHSSSHREIKERETVIVLEDLTALGFFPPKGQFLSIAEVDAAMKSIGFYHGELYSLKLRTEDGFMGTLSDIQIDPIFFPETDNKVYEFMANFGDTVIMKHLQNHILTNQDKQIVLKAKALLNTIKNQGALSIVRKLRKPVEPVAVLCHGDFNANNALFRCKDDGAVECKLLDLQIPIYGSPAIDLSYMLFMNILRSEERKSNLERFIGIYLDGVITRLRTNLGPNVEIPAYLTIQSLMNEFNEVCFASYFTVCFFMPLGVVPLNIIYETEFPGYYELMDIQSAGHQEMSTPNMSKDVESYLSGVYDRFCAQCKDMCIDQILFERTEELLSYIPNDCWIIRE